MRIIRRIIQWAVGRVADGLYEVMRERLMGAVMAAMDKKIERIKMENKSLAERELEEVSALQKRDIRNALFDEAQARHGFSNSKTDIDERGVVFSHGSDGYRKSVVLYPRYERFYSQQQIAELFANAFAYFDKVENKTRNG